MIRFFDPEKNTIQLDMDGVLADFDKFVFDNMGRTFDHILGPGGDDEMWEFLTKVDHLYAILEPTPYAFELFEHAKSLGQNVEILTAIPRRASVPDAEQDKRDWVAKYFGPDVKVNIGPYSKDKWKHAKPADILVDDRADNIQAWINQGFGIGIFHKYTDHQNTLDRLTAMATEHKRF